LVAHGIGLHDLGLAVGKAVWIDDITE